jgi:hypothetical protein
MLRSLTANSSRLHLNATLNRSQTGSNTFNRSGGLMEWMELVVVATFGSLVLVMLGGALHELLDN